jgi:hypothetical protein
MLRRLQSGLPSLETGLQEERNAAVKWACSAVNSRSAKLILAKDRCQSSAVPEAAYGQEGPFPSKAGVSKGWCC